MPWSSKDVARFPRLTDNSDNAVAVRAMAAKAFKYGASAECEWDEVNPMVRDQWCMITAAVLAAMREGK